MFKPEEYLRNAYCVAAQSRDPSNQNGAVLVSQHGIIIGTAPNNFAVGVKFTHERAETRPKKYRYFEHAERAVTYQAARAGHKTYAATMYCPWAACCDCARAIINTGVLTLVMHRVRMSMTPVRWREESDEAHVMLQEAGVTMKYYEEPIEGCPQVIVNGELWSPDSPRLANGSGNYFVEMGK